MTDYKKDFGTFAYSVLAELIEYSDAESIVIVAFHKDHNSLHFRDRYESTREEKLNKIESKMNWLKQRLIELKGGLK